MIELEEVLSHLSAPRNWPEVPVVAVLAVAFALLAHRTVVRVLRRIVARTAHVFVVLVAAAMALTTFPAVRHVGASLLASAGLAGIVAGFAARPVLGNLIAVLQIGLSQPIRLDDVVIVEGEWGVIEEITGAYVVVRIRDERRMVAPLQWWIEHPFQNWTRSSTQLIGTVFLWVDYRMPVEPLRAVLHRVREALVAYVQREYPGYLPPMRADSRLESADGEADGPADDAAQGGVPARAASVPLGH